MLLEASFDGYHIEMFGFDATIFGRIRTASRFGQQTSVPGSAMRRVPSGRNPSILAAPVGRESAYGYINKQSRSAGSARRSRGQLCCLRTLLACVLIFCMAVPQWGPSVAWAQDSSAESEGLSTISFSNPNAQLGEYYLGNDGLITPVRLQNPWGSCWAFAIAAALESSILKAQAETGSITALGAALQGGAGEGEGGETAADASKYEEPQLTGMNTSIDLSERAIGWFAHQLQTEASAGDQAGEGSRRTDEDNAMTQMAGGSFTSVEAMLTAGQAIVAETTAPYQYNGYSDGGTPWYAPSKTSGIDARYRDWSLPEELRTQNDVGWRVRDVLRLESPSVSNFASDGSYTYQTYDAEATQAIKDTLVNIGAVAIALSAETSLPQEVLTGRGGTAQPTEHFSYSTWSQYEASNTFIADHAVTIVGWDDSYSAANFAGTESGQPPADGAWLCKNDWGSDALFAEMGRPDDSLRWGIESEGSATGFFWLSYYDHTISAPTAFIVEPTSDGYDSIYQYDYLANSEFYVPGSYEQDLWVANVFTAEDTELIEAVSAQTFSEGDTVKIKICMLPAASGEDPENVEGSKGGVGAQMIESHELDSAQPVYEAEKSFITAGFHTIDLEAPILVAKGQRFAIMQSIVSGTNPDSRYLNLELAFMTDPTETGQDTFASVVVNEGETYVDLSGEGWVNIADFNAWYADFCAENGSPVDVKYGNALIKAYTNETTMSDGSGQIYELAAL